MTTTSLPTDHDRSPGPISQIPLPAASRSLSTLTRIDYTDAFLLDAGVTRTPQQWADATLKDAPRPIQARLIAAWTALGLELGAPWTGHRVLGWTVRRSDSDVLLLAAGSRLGLQGELLFCRRPDGLLFATFAQLHNPVARAVWARITPHHQRVVRSLLTHAARREAPAQ